MAAAIGRGLLIGLAALFVTFAPEVGPGPRSGAPAAAITPARASQRMARHADFGAYDVSADARYIADWIADSGDNAGAAFIIVDKRAATAQVFDAQARLRGSTRILLGAARGDDSVTNIGTRPIADVRPEERTTPAGRFVAQIGRNALGEDVVWVDYGAAISMHRVRTTNPGERRLQRLATPQSADKRISYGCINVPVEFFDEFIRPVFAERRAVIYVLPEVKDLRQVFGSYAVASVHPLGPQSLR